MTLLALSYPLALPRADIRPARDGCPESRIRALRTAIASGEYRIDSNAIAAKLIASIHLDL